MVLWVLALCVFGLYIASCRSQTRDFLWARVAGCVQETTEGELFRDTKQVFNLLRGRDYSEIKRLKDSEERWRLASEHLRSIILTAHLGIRRDKRIKVFSLDKW